MTAFPETQASLLIQLKSLDDREAWEEFVSLYRPVIYRMARRRHFQEADAQDLTQKVLTSVAGAVQRWEQAEPAVRFRHWLRRVVKNAIVNAVTRRPPDLAIGGLTADQLLQHRAADEESSAEIALEYRREILQRAASIARSDLASETWQAFELTVIEGRAVEEVARQLEQSVGAVYASRGRVMRRLKEEVRRIEEQSQ